MCDSISKSFKIEFKEEKYTLFNEICVASYL